jgi:thymidylate synthase
MKNYHDLLEKIMLTGEDRSDRTGTGTRSLFGETLRFENIDEAFPLATTKKVHWKSIVHELLWFISGDTNIKYLNNNGVTIWDEWADKDGDLGPIYGMQWRAWAALGSDGYEYYPAYIDQLQSAIEGIKTDPHSRRHIVSAWNPTNIAGFKSSISPREKTHNRAIGCSSKDVMALPPCHLLYQFYCHTDNSLSISVYQRSADIFLGVPFNIASYALLLSLVAATVGRRPRNVIMNFGDIHLYNNHTEAAKTQLMRKPFSYPTVRINAKDCIDDYVFEDIALVNYRHHPSIKAPISV